MGLDEFLDGGLAMDDTYDKYTKLKAKLIAEGMPDNLAEYKASELLTPIKLEKIKIATDNAEGKRLGVTFMFDTEEELKVIGKWFKYNPHIAQVKNGKLLIDILKLLEEFNDNV